MIGHATMKPQGQSDVSGCKSRPSKNHTHMHGGLRTRRMPSGPRGGAPIIIYSESTRHQRQAPWSSVFDCERSVAPRNDAKHVVNESWRIPPFSSNKPHVPRSLAWGPSGTNDSSQSATRPAATCSSFLATGLRWDEGTMQRCVVD